MATKYDELPLSETTTKLSSESNDALLSGEDIHERRPKTSRSRSNAVNGAILLLSIVSSLAIGFMAGVAGGRHHTSARDTIQRIQRYSPIMKEIDMSYHMKNFNGSFLKVNAFRQDAGPEVDAAWDSLGVNYRAVVIPEAEAAQSGLLPSQVQVNKKYGGGFPANVEGLHHLHCLNLVRKSLYFNYEHYSNMHHHSFLNSETIVKYHLTHCLDIIRQQLMCTVDTGVLGQVWWNLDEPEPFVDFNTKHQCRNFEAVRKWAEERQMPEDVPADYLQPPSEGDVLAEIP